MDLNTSESIAEIENKKTQTTSKDQNNVIGKFLQHLQEKKNKNEVEVEPTQANLDEESGVTAINKYNPYEQDEDEDDEVFNTVNRIPIPVLPLELDYKPKNVDFSYSFNEAYKIQNLAMNNKALLTKMKEQLPEIGFFRLHINTGGKRHTGEGYKSTTHKKKERRRNSSTTKPRSQKKGDSNGKPESSLEEKVEMLKLEQEISSTGNKMQDFELFKQMMRGGNVKESADIEQDNTFVSSKYTNKNGLTGMFALTDLENESFSTLEPNSNSSKDLVGEKNSSSNSDGAETKKGSKYASFLKESMGNSASPSPDAIDPTTNNNNNASHSSSKLLGFFNQQQEKKSPLQPSISSKPQLQQQQQPQQQFPPNGGFPFNPMMQQQLQNQQQQQQVPNSFNPMMPPPQFFQQQMPPNLQHQQPPMPKNFNPMMPPPQFFQQQQTSQQQQQQQPGNFNPMMGMPQMPSQFMMLTPQQQQMFLQQQHQQQQLNNTQNRR